MKKYVIDRIEGEIAMCECLETGENIEITPPDGAREGDVICFVDGTYEIDHDETKKRHAVLNARLQRLVRGS